MDGKILAVGKVNKKGPWHWILGAGLVLIAAIALIFVYQNNAYKPLSPEDKSIAVLPFQDLSSEQDQEYFSDGIAEEILLALSKIENLKVAGRMSSFSFKISPTHLLLWSFK